MQSPTPRELQVRKVAAEMEAEREGTLGPRQGYADSLEDIDFGPRPVDLPVVQLAGPRRVPGRLTAGEEAVATAAIDAFVDRLMADNPHRSMAQIVGSGEVGLFRKVAVGNVERQRQAAKQQAAQRARP